MAASPKYVDEAVQAAISGGSDTELYIEGSGPSALCIFYCVAHFAHPHATPLCTTGCDDSIALHVATVLQTTSKVADVVESITLLGSNELRSEQRVRSADGTMQSTHAHEHVHASRLHCYICIQANTLLPQASMQLQRDYHRVLPCNEWTLAVSCVPVVQQVACLSLGVTSTSCVRRQRARLCWSKRAVQHVYALQEPHPCVAAM